MPFTAVLAAGIDLSLSLVGAVAAPALVAVALAWAVSRTQALTAWRSAAEGYKEQVTEMTTRLTGTEETMRELHQEINRLSALPDYSDVVARLGVVVQNQEIIKETCSRVEETVHGLESRWG